MACEDHIGQCHTKDRVDATVIMTGWHENVALTSKSKVVVALEGEYKCWNVYLCCVTLNCDPLLDVPLSITACPQPFIDRPCVDNVMMNVRIDQLGRVMDQFCKVRIIVSPQERCVDSYCCKWKKTSQRRLDPSGVHGLCNRRPELSLGNGSIVENEQMETVLA